MRRSGNVSVELDKEFKEPDYPYSGGRLEN
jgi:hypothetical protein